MTTEFRQKLNLSNPIHLLAVGFGSGLAPKAPGTFGSLAAIPIWLAIYHLPLLGYWFLMLLATVGGCWICKRVSEDTQTHDNSHIVWDEMVGMWIALYFVPTTHPLWILLAFVVFRLFDIVKPWPIRWLDQHVAGGIGIMLDDLIASVFTIIVLWLGGVITMLL